MHLYLSYAFCEPEAAWAAALVRWILISAHTLVLLVSGIAVVMNDITYVFLLFWTYFESTLLFNSIQRVWAESKPVCSLADSIEFSKSRCNGMPSEELYFVSVICAFLILHQYLVQKALPFSIEKFILFLVPVSAVCLYATRNINLVQMVVSIVLGSVNGIYSVLIYHCLMKYHFTAIREFYHLGWVLPGGEIPKVKTELDDWDAQLLQN